MDGYQDEVIWQPALLITHSGLIDAVQQSGLVVVGTSI